MRRLVCVIEGHGERDAAPVLCNRVLRELLGIHEGWYIDERPVRVPRGRLVDATVPSPKRLPHAEGVHGALRLAEARGPDGILVLCDADDDCPATWGPQVQAEIASGGRPVPVAAVMASREFESWLLWGFDEVARERVKAIDPERSPRDAKRAMGALIAGYKPTVHQRAQTRALDLVRAWAGSDSFDKLVRSIARLVGVETPERPGR